MKISFDTLVQCARALYSRSTPPALFALLGMLAIAPAAQAADVFTPGMLRSETFNGANRTQVESGAVTIPTAVEYVSSFQFADVADNYARRVSGFFIPPTTGNYVFFVTSDDDSDLFLSTDATPANKRLIAQETGWSGSLSWTNSAGGSLLAQKRSDQFVTPGTTNKPFAAGIPLVAGTRYYIEGVHAEGGGGDNFAATFKLVGQPDPESGTDSAMTGAVIGMLAPDRVTIVAHPVNRRVAPNSTVTFTTAAEPPTATFQWFRNGVAITGETANTYTTPALTSADNGVTYHVVASDAGQSTTSSNAVVTIGSLVPIPKSLRRDLWNDDAITRDEVNDPTFATPPDLTDTLPVFETPSNFSDNYVQKVSGLFVPSVTGNYIFFVAADDQADLFLSTDSAPANKRLIAQETGWSPIRLWNGVGGAGGGLTTEEAIAQKRSDGFRVPPVDTNTPPPFASGIPLTAGTSYYIEAVQEEGGGGDNLAVTFKLVGEPNPNDNDPSRINSSLIGNFPGAVALNGATINITSPPQTTNGLQSRTVTLRTAAVSGYQGDASGAGPGITYQWQTAPAGSSTFTNVPGAMGQTFTTPTLLLSESGRQYRVLVSAGDTQATSAPAIVNITPDAAAPRPVTVTGVNAARNVVTLTFNEVLDVASAQTGANYSFGPGGIAGGTVTLANGTNLTINTASPLTPNVENTLTITGVKDQAGNTVAPATTIKFTFNPVTYAANILFDQPVAFYRFEETSGSVATNSGTVGGNAVYSEGDEAAPGDGGTPGTAKGDAGPRPPLFAGFDPQNRAATFDGVDDWVDTRNQYLQGVGAFTLEYWVKPVRTNTVDGTVWPNRVALVGQNDAVEYGFINPATIQIWTAGGGSLDTTYRTNGVALRDNEWHHVATIGNGTSIRTYFDGALVGTGGSATANYGSSLYNVHIGGAGGFDAGGNWFTGQMDEVAIFNKAIPAERVAAHYRAGKEGGVITISGAVTPAEPGGGGDGPRLTASKTGSNITISWSPTGGTLESTVNLNSPIVWTEVGTANPAVLPTSDRYRFFRVRR